MGITYMYNDSFDQQNTQFNSFEGKLLVASPHLGDQYFERALVYICAHDVNGAIGIIINQKIGTISSQDLIKYTNSKFKENTNKKFTVLFGGPVYSDKVVVLSLSKEQQNTISVQHGVTLYTDINMFLKDYSAGKLKTKFIFAKGVATWDSRQLETEIAENSWFVTPASIDILFSQRIKHKWDIIIKELGVNNLHSLVCYSGNA